MVDLCGGEENMSWKLFFSPPASDSLVLRDALLHIVTMNVISGSIFTEPLLMDDHYSFQSG